MPLCLVVRGATGQRCFLCHISLASLRPRPARPRAQQECSWFSECDAGALQPVDGTFRTEAVGGNWTRGAASFASRARHSQPLVWFGLRPFAEVEPALIQQEAEDPAGVGRVEADAGNASAYGGVWLSEEQLDRAVSHARRSRRLACFVRAAVRSPVIVAALGGSITSGLPFGTLSGREHLESRYLYHRKLASYMCASCF